MAKLSEAQMLEEIGEGCLYLDGCGQKTRPLESDPVAKANHPPLTGWCDTSYLSRYLGTDFVQWYGRRADGKFHPWGKIMRITPAGRRALEQGEGE